jgi:hypothetical protein
MKMGRGSKKNILICRGVKSSLNFCCFKGDFNFKNLGKKKFLFPPPHPLP